MSYYRAKTYAREAAATAKNVRVRADDPYLAQLGEAIEHLSHAVEELAKGADSN